jgi:hypothetical protein
MKKTDILKFIELYNLGGIVEKVKIVSDGKNLSASFVTEERTLYGTLVYNNLAIDAGEYGIHDTKQFIKMLNVLEEDISVKVVCWPDGRPCGLEFSDKNAESLALLADLSVIPKAPLGVNVGKVDLEINIDDEFIERYIRAKNALSDVKTFTFVPNAKTGKAELIMGYSNISTNRIRLEIKATAGKDKPEKLVSFNADCFKEVLMKNRDMTGTVLKVNSAGLAHLHFKTTDYEAHYYLLKVTDI